MRTFSRRAYKLGKKKRSYNQVELTFERGSGPADGEEPLCIYEATERTASVDVSDDMRDSVLEYELRLYNGAVVRAAIFIVYAEPLGREEAKGSDSRAGGFADGKAGYTWLPVTRSRCVKGCSGPVLSAIQRFGKQGRTQKIGKGAAAGGGEPARETSDSDKWKDSRNLFISIDEASNHVCAFGPHKCKVFR